MLTTVQVKITLLKNLMNRFEFNKPNRIYTIKGVITEEEMNALRTARNLLEANAPN